MTTQQDQIRTLTDRNAELSAMLVKARDTIAELGKAPNSLGTYLWPGADGTAIVDVAGRKMRVAISPQVDQAYLVTGEEVIFSDANVIIELAGADGRGQVATVAAELPDGRLRVVTGLEDDAVMFRAAHFKDELSTGDTVLVNARLGVVFELLERDETEALLLEKVPDITYADIGGLDDQVSEIRDAIELPYLHKDLFAAVNLRAPKGVLLYGPPGVGKTLLAKAVANSLAKKVAGDDACAYFISIKGPELLSKWVGETERQIRVTFAQARKKASEGMPVVVFFDEMESMFRTRGSGISSDMESTIVPQLLAEIDGVEDLSNVIVIGASNREDLIDPAVLRPGRLDIKIKIGRPDREAAAAIFGKYLTEDLPLSKKPQALIDDVVARMYEDTRENEFLEVTYVNGDRETMYFKDFNSGAMVENIVSRAKKRAIKEHLKCPETKLRITGSHLLDSVVDEFRENGDLPNTTNPDDWARISGKKGERIANVRPLLKRGDDKTTETVRGEGMYL